MRFFFLLILITPYQPLFAQGPEKALAQFEAAYPQEKVVLLFSKPDYIAGETIHFKAYLLKGYEASDISGNLYVELYDAGKTLIDKQIIPVFKSAGSGTIALPANLAEEVYFIRAYTQWMLNFDPAFQLIKPLRIYNPYSSQSLRQKPVQWTAKTAIEGGKLVEGTAANIAVRLTTGGSLPPFWSGQLLENETNRVVTDVVVYNSEVGQVRFVPEAGKTYQLRLKDNAGNAQELDLPPSQSQGLIMQVSSANSNLLRYGIGFKGIPSAGVGYRLVASMNQQAVFVASVNKSGGQIGGTFDIKNLPPGILQLTLFDEKGNFVIERLCFLHQRALQVNTPAVTTDTLSFAPKGYNHWQMAIDTLAWETYAITVTDAELPQEENFLPAVYLTTDLTSAVHQADWYFTDVTDTKIAALDALLLTEKWNRFQWNAILQNQFPIIRYKPDANLSFGGMVLKNKKPQPLRDMYLILQGKESSVSFVQVKTDDKGSFSLQNFFFTDSVKVFYQPGKQKFLEGEISISAEPLNRFQPFSGRFPHTEWTTGVRLKQDTVPSLVKRAIAQRTNERLLSEKTSMMEEVVVTTKIKTATEEMDKKLSSSLFSSQDALVIDFVNNNHLSALGSASVLEWMQGRVAGYSVIYQNGEAVPQIRNNRVQLFLNEVPVMADVINSIPVPDIAMVKVFRNGFLGGTGGNSAIAIYTRTGDMPSTNSMPTLPVLYLEGYRKLLPFYSLDYSVSGNREVSDQRLVLYHTNLPEPSAATGKTPLLFYNNDSAHKYRLRVTGFTSGGKLVYSNQLIEE